MKAARSFFDILDLDENPIPPYTETDYYELFPVV